MNVGYDWIHINAISNDYFRRLRDVDVRESFEFESSNRIENRIDGTAWQYRITFHLPRIDYLQRWTMRNSNDRRASHTNVLNEVQNDSHFGSNYRTDNLKFVSFNLGNVRIEVDFSSFPCFAYAWTVRETAKTQDPISANDGTVDCCCCRTICLDFSGMVAVLASHWNENEVEVNMRRENEKFSFTFR